MIILNSLHRLALRAIKVVLRICLTMSVLELAILFTMEANLNHDSSDQNFHGSVVVIVVEVKIW